MYDVFKISKYFIEQGKGTQYPVTNMKLQKLLYYSQGWFLAANDVPLFENEFYKWNFGPVCIDVYYQYKHFGGRPIIDSIEGLTFSKELIEFLNYIWDSYGQFSAFQLSALSHTEEPWINTESSEIISKEIIKKYYKEKLTGVKN